MCGLARNQFGRSGLGEVDSSFLAWPPPGVTELGDTKASPCVYVPPTLPKTASKIRRKDMLNPLPGCCNYLDFVHSLRAPRSNSVRIQEMLIKMQPLCTPLLMMYKVWSSPLASCTGIYLNNEEKLCVSIAKGDWFLCNVNTVANKASKQVLYLKQFSKECMYGHLTVRKPYPERLVAVYYESFMLYIKNIFSAQVKNELIFK